MNTDYEAQLCGSAKEAKLAADQIGKYVKRYGQSGHKDAQKHQLLFGINVLRSVCNAVEGADGKHYDLYCEVVASTLMPSLESTSSVKYWSKFLECVRYLHYQLLEKKCYDNAWRIYKAIAAHANCIQQDEDYKYVLGIYGPQLLSFRFRTEVNREKEKQEMLHDLEQLFEEMFAKNKDVGLMYPEVVKDLMQWLLPKIGVSSVMKFLSTSLPAKETTRMFEAFFTLYGSQKLTVPSAQEVEAHAQQALHAVYTFIQFDILDRLQQQLALRFLRACRTECRLQANKAIADIFLLLYDYLELLYAQSDTDGSMRVYIKRCEKFRELIEKLGKTCMEQLWFGDVLVVLNCVHAHIVHTSGSSESPFNRFWKQMRTPACYKSLFDLIVSCIKLAPGISTETRLFSLSCCTSTRKHVIVSYAQIALAAYAIYCQNISERIEEDVATEEAELEPNEKSIEGLQKTLILIINHAFKVIERMICISPSSSEINGLLVRFKQITVSARTIRQARTCIMLGELLLKIKPKITDTEWHLVLRRLYKTAALITKDPKLSKELQTCYIASLLQHSNRIDFALVRNQIGVYYNGEQSPAIAHTNCLLATLANSKSPFKPHLEPSRKRLLNWLDTQHILKYHRTNTELLHSLLQSSESQYDFVITTRIAKLSTYALPKLQALCKSMRAKARETCGLGRLEQLTYAHACTILWQEQNESQRQRFQVESKDCQEDNLGQLLLRKEFSSFTISNEMRVVKVAIESLKAFEEFFGGIDHEHISSDEALIDWESMVDDVAALAQYLQLSGYLEYASEAWILHYRCSRMLQDEYNALRGLAYFCEYSEYLDHNCNGLLNLSDEIKESYPILINALESMPTLQRRNQNYVLLALLQIAYYYARSSKYSFSEMLLQLVEQQHQQLPERVGKYDMVLATMEAVRFRLLWKHLEAIPLDNERSEVKGILLKQCLLREIELTLDRFRDFVYISSGDALGYMILIITLTQEIAECTANRLCDNFVSVFFIAVCKLTLQSNLALRFVQVMTMWMWINLQMEYVDKAQIKLKIIECVMGVKNSNEIKENCSMANAAKRCDALVVSSGRSLFAPNQNPSMEAVRKLTQVQLSPIRTGNLELSPSARKCDLKRYFKYDINSTLLPQDDLLEWTYFAIGCMNARLYFLVADYEQLDDFYECGLKWLEGRRNSFHKQYYKHIYLLAIQHYVNYLRCRKKYDLALACLRSAIERCELMKFDVDVVYRVNFLLQLRATQKEIVKGSESPTEEHRKVRRVLRFNVSPEKEERYEEAKRAMRDHMLQQAMASNSKTTFGAKKFHATPKSIRRLPFVIGSTTKAKNQNAECNILEPSSKVKLKFNICEDVEVIELNDKSLIEVDDNSGAQYKNTTKAITSSGVSQRKTPNCKRLEQTPVVTKKLIKSKCLTSARKRVSRKMNDCQIIYDIDLISSTDDNLIPLFDKLETKENHDTNKMITKLESLKIVEGGTSRDLQKPKITRKPAAKETSDSEVICLIESPQSPSPSRKQPETVSMRKISRFENQKKNPASVKDAEILDLNPTVSNRKLRQRKGAVHENENVDCVSTTTLPSSSRAAAISTRRRQKI